MNEFVVSLNKLKFQILLKIESGPRWNPIAIEDIENVLAINYKKHTDFNYKVRKNIAYNLQ